MVEVFRTNVQDRAAADALLELIHARFSLHRASFDLEDCDRILRVCSEAPVQTKAILQLLQEQGYVAEPLPDQLPVPLLSLSSTPRS